MTSFEDLFSTAMDDNEPFTNFYGSTEYENNPSCDPRADRIEYLFGEILEMCGKPPTPQELLVVRSSLSLATELFYDLSKDPTYGCGHDQWYELNSLFNQVNHVAGKLFEVPGEVGGNPVASWRKARVWTQNCRDTRRSFENIKLNEDSPSHAVKDTWHSYTNIKGSISHAATTDDRKRVKPENESVQHPPVKVTQRYSDPCAFELWNQEAMMEVAGLIKELLDTPPPDESPEQITEFLSGIEEIVVQLDGKDGRVRKTYFPFHLAFRLLPNSLQREFLRTRDMSRPPNSAELLRYLTTYFRSITKDNRLYSQNAPQKSFSRKRVAETNASKVWGSSAMGHVAEIIEELLLEVPSPMTDPEELFSFKSTIGDISKRLENEDIKMRKNFLPFYLAFRVLPTSVKCRFINSRKTTCVPHFDELRKFLTSYASPTQFRSFAWKESPNALDRSTIPRQVPSTPSVPGNSSTAPIIKPAEPSMNPVVFGSHEKRCEEEFFQSSGKHPVSLLSEFCTRRKFKQPEFSTVKEDGPPHQKRFIIKVTVNGVDYVPSITSSTKKIAKSEAAKVCLRSLGVLSNSKVINPFIQFVR